MDHINDLLNLNNVFNQNNFSNLKILRYLRRRRGVVYRRRRQYRIRRRIDPMIEYNRREFKRRFRFSKEEVRYLFNLIDGPNTLQPMVCIIFAQNVYYFEYMNSFVYMFIRLLVQDSLCQQ